MSLTENQVNRVWQKMVEAEVRSLYFADLAARDTVRKQMIIGTSFFLSSGAAAAVIGKLPPIVPTLLALFAAIITAYSIAVNLDKRVGVLVKLHCQWNHLTAEYERLWNHWYEDDAEKTLGELLKRAAEASEIAVEMPNDEARLDKWQTVVYSRVSPATA